MEGRHRRRLGLLGLSLAGLVLALGAVVGVMLATTGPRWEEMGRWSEELVQEASRREVPRVLLRPTTSAGDAWDAYHRACVTAEGSGRSGAVGFLWKNDASLLPEVRAWVARNALALSHLEKGARLDRLDASARERWMRERESVHGGRAHELLGVAAGDAILKLDLGDGEGALGRLLDMLQFGRDAADGGDSRTLWNATRYVRYAVEKFGQPARLGRTRLEVLEAAVTKLIGEQPSREFISRMSLAQGGRLLYSKGWQGWKEKVQISEERYRPGWRHLWSERRLALDLFGQHAAHVLGATGIDGWSPEERAAYDSGLSELPQLEKDYGVFALAQDVDHAETFLVLIRTALRWSRTGIVEEAKNAWGASLRHQVDGDRLTLWSSGWDGSEGSSELRLKVAR